MLFCLSARGLMLFYQNPKLIRLIPNKKEKVFLIEGGRCKGSEAQREKGTESQRNKFTFCFKITLCLCYFVPQNCFVPLPLKLFLLISPIIHNYQIFFNTVDWGFALVGFLFDDKVESFALFLGKVKHFFYTNNSSAKNSAFVASCG